MLKEQKQYQQLLVEFDNCVGELLGNFGELWERPQGFLKFPKKKFPKIPQNSPKFPKIVKS